MNRPLIIGTRGSALALWQANAVAAMLRARHADLEIALEIIETKGDRVLDTSLEAIGDKGLFTKELEVALLERRIDCAVHSLKDMQTELPEGLSLGAVPERADPRDALVAPEGMTIARLREGAVVATGSIRRRAQLLSLRPDLEVVDVRGNVPTRVRKYRESGWDGMILAAAGLKRLDMEGEIAALIPPEVMVPAAGQGALAIEMRGDDEEIFNLLLPLDHAPTRYAVEAERAFLARLDGGCRTPIGAHATVDGDRLELVGILADRDGTRVVRGTIDGTTDEAEALGRRLAEQVEKEATTL
jgi:hydroxymethylbilane synthase